MIVKDRVGNEIKPGDFVVYVTAGDRHPVLEFGWVIKFHETRDSYSGEGSGNFKIKLQRSEPNGTRHTVRVVDVEGHFRDGAPKHVSDYWWGVDNGYKRTQEEYNEWYVPATYRDSGKPSTTMLDVHNGINKRLLLTQPV